MKDDITGINGYGMTTTFPFPILPPFPKKKYTPWIPDYYDWNDKFIMYLNN